MKRGVARSEESIEFARSQRASVNEFAATVWQWIRNRNCCGQKFRREYSIPPYTVDFCCIELRLIIEIDGDFHFTEAGVERDCARDEYLKKLGYQVVRIRGYDVLREEVNVAEKIRGFVQAAIKAQILPPQLHSPT